MGAILAAIMPLLLGLLTGVPLSVLTAVYTLAVVAALKWWVEPRLTPHRRVSPMLTVVFLIALADAYGLFGIILAPPLAAACQILWNRMISHRTAFRGGSPGVRPQRATAAAGSHYQGAG
ncbi:MAG: AI-2E family transporter [Chloroflexi bacterium]|nr:AI-2E family transporter [Chloroflexota bacterium]